MAEVRKILVADFDEDNLFSTVALLKKQGYEVITASDGLEALDRFSQDTPHLVLLSPILPKLHGFQVCKMMKKIKKGRKIPVLIISGIYKSSLYKYQAINEFFADDLLVKPIEDKKLLHTIKSYFSPTKETSHKVPAQKESPKIPEIPTPEVKKDGGIENLLEKTLANLMDFDDIDSVPKSAHSDDVASLAKLEDTLVDLMQIKSEAEASPEDSAPEEKQRTEKAEQATSSSGEEQSTTRIPLTEQLLAQEEKPPPIEKTPPPLKSSEKKEAFKEALKPETKTRSSLSAKRTLLSEVDDDEIDSIIDGAITFDEVDDEAEEESSLGGKLKLEEPVSETSDKDEEVDLAQLTSSLLEGSEDEDYRDRQPHRVESVAADTTEETMENELGTDNIKAEQSTTSLRLDELSPSDSEKVQTYKIKIDEVMDSLDDHENTETDEFADEDLLEEDILSSPEPEEKSDLFSLLNVDADEAPSADHFEDSVLGFDQDESEQMGEEEGGEEEEEAWFTEKSAQSMREIQKMDQFGSPEIEEEAEADEEEEEENLADEDLLSLVSEKLLQDGDFFEEQEDQFKVQVDEVFSTPDDEQELAAEEEAIMAEEEDQHDIIPDHEEEMDALIPGQHNAENDEDLMSIIQDLEEEEEDEPEEELAKIEEHGVKIENGVHYTSLEEEYGMAFGKYILLEKVATGGMAEIFKAKQRGVEGFEKLVAIKRILPHLSDNKDFVSMFIDEGKIAAQLTHQNIAQIYELGEEQGYYYIAMEFVNGRDLKTLMQRAKEKNFPLSLEHAVVIISKLCSGLDYAHRKKDFDNRDLNIVHRDISPQNVLISYEGEVKIVDFGIAKAAAKDHHTRAGALKGKILYMSPEQAWGKNIDKRSDIFSLGTLLYEMMTQKRLFLAQSEIQILQRVREARITPPSQLRPDLPKQLEAIILKALTKDPNQRYQAASEMQRVLDRFLYTRELKRSTFDLSTYMHLLFREEIEGEVPDSADRIREIEAMELLSKEEDEESVAELEEDTVATRAERAKRSAAEHVANGDWEDTEIKQLLEDAKKGTSLITILTNPIVIVIAVLILLFIVYFVFWVPMGEGNTGSTSTAALLSAINMLCAPLS
ncbi:protein kinase [candidate division CSSED10-310 bacterium]|uniref:non-specific serine/threonine protein kinase n=1 Tax=candidate division CSSED10-310 bacterium TaxID=2855610 RepID=A0ABV6YRY1_UNCC1